MRMDSRFIRSFMVGLAGVAVMSLGLQAADPPNFKPDGTFKGSTLAGWRVVGDAEWKAQNGELVGTAKPGTAGGWLVMDKGFENIDVFANYMCVGPCQSGIMLRAEKTQDGGLRGSYLSLTSGDLAPYTLTVDARGKEVSRARIAAPVRGGGAPPAPLAGFAPGSWNSVEVIAAATTLRALPGGGGPIAATGFGPVALYVGGTGTVHFKDVAWKDLNTIVEEPARTSPRYTAHQISSFYYGWSTAAADINHDGIQDIVSGPFYYTGPDFKSRHIFRADRIYNASLEYAPDMVNLAADFTGDGWPDVLASGMEGGRPMTLYVNPKGESRAWDSFKVLPTISTEIVLLRDLDKDGKPEVIFGGGGVYSWARPDVTNPMSVWTSHPMSTAGSIPVAAHGIGVGDINGDGRPDVVVPNGWMEQPAGGIDKPWIVHTGTFWPKPEFSNGGGEMGVFDVNGDGLADVISGSAHAWGLTWFEQKKAADGTRSFVPHEIAGDFATKNAGGVVFSESHAQRYADMNGDGIPDMITGKRYWSHLENYNGEDPYGAAVIYIYKTVRNPKAPGGAEFVPELIHNKSGVGSTFEVADLNKDGIPDIATQGAYGTYVFLSKPVAK